MSKVRIVQAELPPMPDPTFEFSLTLDEAEKLYAILGKQSHRFGADYLDLFEALATALSEVTGTMASGRRYTTKQNKWGSIQVVRLDE